MSISYNFLWSDPSKPTFFVTSDIVDTTSTSLLLNGKGTINWGQDVQQNMLYMLENFASRASMVPVVPTIGQVWYDMDHTYLNVYGYPMTPATLLIPGNLYTIITPGNTDFTLVGAVNSNTNTVFTATGAGIGTGVAKSQNLSWSEIISRNSLTTTLNTVTDNFLSKTNAAVLYSTTAVGTITATTSLTQAQTGMEFVVYNSTITSQYHIILPTSGIWRFRFFGGTNSVDPLSEVYLQTSNTIYFTDGTSQAAGTISKINLSNVGNATEVWSDGTSTYISKCEGNAFVKTATVASHAVPLAQVNSLISAAISPISSTGAASYAPIAYTQSGSLSAATTLTTAQSGLEFTIATISNFNITLPAAPSVWRYKFFGASIASYTVYLVWGGGQEFIMPDGTLATSPCPVNLATNGNAVEIWSNGAKIFMSKCEGNPVVKTATLNNQAVPLAQTNSLISTAVTTNSIASINTQVGTTYTLALTDGSGNKNNPYVSFGNASPTTVTIPLNTTVAFPIGTVIECIQDGAGKVTFAGAVGVTILSTASLKSIASQYTKVTLIQESLNQWYLLGSLIA